MGVLLVGSRPTRRPSPPAPLPRSRARGAPPDSASCPVVAEATRPGVTAASNFLVAFLSGKSWSWACCWSGADQPVGPHPRPLSRGRGRGAHHLTAHPVQWLLRRPAPVSLRPRTSWSPSCRRPSPPAPLPRSRARGAPLESTSSLVVSEATRPGVTAASNFLVAFLSGKSWSWACCWSGADQPGWSRPTRVALRAGLGAPGEANPGWSLRRSQPGLEPPPEKRPQRKLLTPSAR